MALSLRQLRRRIRSVEGTKKMTHAMEMVAATKLRRFQSALVQSDRYIHDVTRILSTLVREKPLAHPLLEKRPEIHSSLVFLMTSDTGLCGSYNINVLDTLDQFMEESGDPKTISFVALGRSGAGFLRRKGLGVTHEMTIPRPQDIDHTIKEMAQIAVRHFAEREVDQVFLVYTRVVSLASLKPRVEKLFPISGEHALEEKTSTVDYLLEPTLDQVLEVILPEYVEAKTGQCVRHALVAEQASRMMAMRQATDNAKEMIDSLTLLRNKMRQASITKELIEVASGSAAQKR